MNNNGRIILKDFTGDNKVEVESSFNAIYNAYYRLVYFVSLDVTKNNEDSKDIVNETFFKLYENRKKMKDVNGIKYYLVVTAKNLSINLINKMKRETVFNDDISVSSEELLIDSFLEKFKEYLDKEELKILVYHLIYELGFREISELTGISINTISSKYRRAVNKLKEHYKE